MAPATTTSTTASPSSAVLVAFPDPASTEGWINVDDSVMGGISASETEWLDGGGEGALVFTGLLSTESNGGFSSVLSPTDRAIGQRASDAIALQVNAIGDGRTYLLQLRAGREGNERWIARFTPLTYRPRTDTEESKIPISSFQFVDRFLRPMQPSTPLDPSTIVQVGVYVLDGQIGQFRLTLESISAIR